MMGGRELEVTKVEKDVGVMVADTLKPSLQCAAAAAKANMIMGQLSRAVQWRDKITFPKLFMSHVRPVLEYAGTVWCPYFVGDREILEKVQRRMVSMIPGMRGSYEDKLRVLGMTTLQRRRERGDLIQTWRILQARIELTQPSGSASRVIRPEREQHLPGSTEGTRLCWRGHHLDWR